MYVKIFSQIYDGTLCTKGPWQALVTFQQLLVLADQDGNVDMTDEAISRRTTIPLEIIQTGLKALVEADDRSRTPTEEGRRIVLLSDHRDWGWHIVNYEHYRRMKREEDRREYHQTYYHEKRKKQKEQGKQQLNTFQHFQPSQPIAEAYAEAGKPMGVEATTPEFEDAWKAYPKRSGNNPKRDALKSWNARTREGVTAQAMTEGMARYDRWCQATGKIGTETVMTAARFWGPARPFEQEFSLPRVNGSANPWYASDAGILAKGTELAMAARPGESIYDYKARINGELERRGL